MNKNGNKGDGLKKVFALNLVPYLISKTGVGNLFRSLAIQKKFGPFGQGITGLFNLDCNPI